VDWSRYISKWDFGVHPASLQIDRRSISRLLVGPFVAIEAKQAAEIADNQIATAVAIDIFYPGSAVTPGRAAIDHAVSRSQSHG